MPFKVQPPLYAVWQGMRRRCLNPRFKQWGDYGGRGISICPQWSDYETFARDMGPKPDGTSLDRIDNDGNYEPGNCRWSTKIEQQRNQRQTRFVTIEGKRHRAIDLADIAGVKTDTVIYRAAQGLEYADVTAKTLPISSKVTESARQATAIRVANQRAKMFCKHGHSFTEGNTGRTSHGTRYCRECHRLKAAAQRAARRRS